MIKGGPKIINDGLVLCLDAHDAKSYAGEPTTNFSTNPKFETGTHDSSSGGTWNNWVFGTWNSYNHKIVDVTDAGMIASGFTKALRVTSDGTSNSQHLSNNNWGSNITAGTVFSLSFWGRASASDTTWIYSQWGGTVGYPEFTTEWKYFKFDNITKAASSGSQYPYFRFEYGPPPSGQWFEVTGFQVEAKSYSTPLADTSRSAVDGWKDRTTNSYDGTLVSMAGTGASHYRDGQVIMPVSNSYLEFDGTDDYIDLGTTAGNFGTDPFTVSVWLNFDALGSFYNKYAADQDQILFSHSGGKPYFIYNAPNGTDYGYTVSNTTISTGTWYNLVATVDRSSVYPVIYVNGSNDGSSSQSSAGSPTTANMDNTGNLRIGRGLYSGNYSYFNGKMAQLLVYKGKALTAAEILSNYNATKGRF